MHRRRRRGLAQTAVQCSNATVAVAILVFFSVHLALFRQIQQQQQASFLSLDNHQKVTLKATMTLKRRQTKDLLLTSTWDELLTLPIKTTLTDCLQTALAHNKKIQTTKSLFSLQRRVSVNKYPLSTRRGNNNTNTTLVCQPPSAPQHDRDDTTTYAVMLLAHQLDSRSIVINCLKWLLDPACAEIWILLPTDFHLLLNNNNNNKKNEYASRLWRWNSQADHPVQLVRAVTLEESIARVYQQSTRSTVLWATRAWRDDTALLLNLYQENAADGIVAARSYTVCSCRMGLDLHGLVTSRDNLCVFASARDDLHAAATVDWNRATQAMAVWLSQFDVGAMSTVPWKIASGDAASLVSELLAHLGGASKSYNELASLSAANSV
jgi:hypothetical protein